MPAGTVKNRAKNGCCKTFHTQIRQSCQPQNLRNAAKSHISEALRFPGHHTWPKAHRYDCKTPHSYGLKKGGIIIHESVLAGISRIHGTGGFRRNFFMVCTCADNINSAHSIGILKDLIGTFSCGWAFKFDFQPQEICL